MAISIWSKSILIGNRLTHNSFNWIYYQFCFRWNEFPHFMEIYHFMAQGKSDKHTKQQPRSNYVECGFPGKRRWWGWRQKQQSMSTRSKNFFFLCLFVVKLFSQCFINGFIRCLFVLSEKKKLHMSSVERMSVQCTGTESIMKVDAQNRKISIASRSPFWRVVHTNLLCCSCSASSLCGAPQLFHFAQRSMFRRV